MIINQEALRRAIITIKRSRGPKETRAMFAKMGASGGLFPKGAGGVRLAPASGSDTTDREIINFLNSIDTSGGGIEKNIIPVGRAPRGQGNEYQTRRWINDRISGLISRRNNLEDTIRQDRGSKRQRGRMTRNQMVIDAINESLGVSRHVIKNMMDSGIPFADAKQLFDDLFSIPFALAGGT